MKSVNFVNRWKNVSNTILRFPLTVIFLLAATICNALVITGSNSEIYIKIAISLGMGALLFADCQLIYERFFNKASYRYIFMASSIILTFLHYLTIKNNIWNVDLAVKTAVVYFVLVILLMWIPSLKSRINFNQSFLLVFKSFFMALFLTGILFIGVAVILGATHLLLFDVDADAYLHAANIIFVFIAPLCFLLYIPLFPVFEPEAIKSSKDNALEDNNSQTEAYYDSQEKVNYIDGNNLAKLYAITTSGKFLETLVSYVIIPVAAVFTLILLIYILINITGSFWTDNLLESMLVSYSITVILVYLLASNIENAWTKIFRLIFPKVLVVVVLFQTISSFMRISKYGITSGRYYVILFGLFATIAGIIFCIVPKEKNGIIAPILIAFSLISILPGIDAFTISKNNQISKLKTALERNNMLSDNEIIPKKDIPDEDKEIIISSFTYLRRMNYADNISWLSAYKESYDFEKVFGFPMYQDIETKYNFVNVNREPYPLISIEGYDFLAIMDINDSHMEEPQLIYTKGNKSYNLNMIANEDGQRIIELKEEQTVIASFPVLDIFERFIDDTNFETKSMDEVTFTSANDKAEIKVIVDYLSFNTLDISQDYVGQLYVLVKIK